MTSTIFGKNSKKIKDLVAVFGTEQPTEAQNTSYHDVKIEPLAYRSGDHAGKRLFSYDESSEHLWQRGFERHLRPAEAFGLLADNLEGKLKDPALQIATDDMLKVSPEYIEWLSCAVERKGDVLVVYLDPVGLQWNSKTGTYDIQETLKYNERREFSIAGKQLEGLVELREFSNDFITYFYGKAFDALPEEMKQEDKGAKVHLPPEGRIYPGCRYKFSIWFNYFFGFGASRGRRLSSPKNSIENRIEKDEELYKPPPLERRLIKEYPDGSKLIGQELCSGLSLHTSVFPPGHKFVELPPLEDNAQYNPPPLPINKQHSLTDDIKKIGHELGLSIMKDGIYWSIRLGLGAVGIAYFYETCNSHN